MMRRVQRPFLLADSRGTVLGSVRAVLSHRSAEETEEDELNLGTETAMALIPARFAPDGGFARGMVLTYGTARYRMLIPVEIGRYWRIKCERVYSEREAAYAHA